MSDQDVLPATVIDLQAELGRLLELVTGRQVGQGWRDRSGGS